jgi:hypothetical protein
MEGVDLTDRISALRSLGHEIGQHTHFYASRGGEGDVVDDFSEENVRTCIGRDFEYLTRRGVVPGGFVAGAWAFPDPLVRILVEYGFIYDCSARIPTSFNVSSAHIPCIYVDSPMLVELRNQPLGDRQVLLLPTTCSLGRWYKARLGSAASLPKAPLIYFHDYDLLRLSTYALANHLCRLSRSYSVSAVKGLGASTNSQCVEDIGALRFRNKQASKR